MTTFWNQIESNIHNGPLQEIPEISVDRFDMNSSLFFLSHAHTDHMNGLETDEFKVHLEKPGNLLICHQLTPVFLKYFEGKYLGGADGIQNLIDKKKLIPMDVDKPVKLSIPRCTDKLEVKVTLLSAGHSPGSVMFLFRTKDHQILHTGDFRLSLENLKHLRHLHDDGKLVKQITHLYIDTTHCYESPRFEHRKKVFGWALGVIKQRVCMGYDIYISFPAHFCHEYVLLELYNNFKQKIRVSEKKFQVYESIKELKDIVTKDENEETQFHLLDLGKSAPTEKENVLTFKLSSWWFTLQQDRRYRISHYDERNRLIRFCYSMHASLDEVVQAINYLKPKYITPLVLPKGKTLKQVHLTLRKLCKESWQFKFSDQLCPIDFEVSFIPTKLRADVVEDSPKESTSQSQPECPGPSSSKKARTLSPTLKPSTSSGESPSDQSRSSSQDMDFTSKKMTSTKE